MTVVVKLGSSLVVRDGRPDTRLLRQVADRVAAMRPACVVSSGAIALGAARRPATLPGLQAASALGQPALHAAWARAFAGHAVSAAQVLLTGADIAEPHASANLRNTLRELLRQGVVPVLNENDATATEEISFGDNDVLAAQVAVLLGARTLILLTNVDGVLDGDDLVADGTHARLAPIGPGSPLGRGGMASKIAAAEVASAAGVSTVITSPRSLGAIVEGGRPGTWFDAAAAS
ncbi:MAG TPA: glutamate 5-kinase [Gaiellaceae bacterium]|nr:glutamate 5-kinase [Gaiellaceae bacterium]